jgi:hypothetical protein
MGTTIVVCTTGTPWHSSGAGNTNKRYGKYKAPWEKPVRRQKDFMPRCQKHHRMPWDLTMSIFMASHGVENTRESRSRTSIEAVSRRFLERLGLGLVSWQRLGVVSIGLVVKRIAYIRRKHHHTPWEFANVRALSQQYSERTRSRNRFEHSAARRFPPQRTYQQK